MFVDKWFEFKFTKKESREQFIDNFRPLNVLLFCHSSTLTTTAPLKLNLLIFFLFSICVFCLPLERNDIIKIFIPGFLFKFNNDSVKFKS